MGPDGSAQVVKAAEGYNNHEGDAFSPDEVRIFFLDVPVCVDFDFVLAGRLRADHDVNTFRCMASITWRTLS